MRFFEAPEKAWMQTLQLLLLFGLAMLALVLSVNGALALNWRLVSPGWTGYPAVHHMLLVSDAPPTRWFASHPPLAERIRRIYGRSMPVLPARHDKAVTRPDALF